MNSSRFVLAVVLAVSAPLHAQWLQHRLGAWRARWMASPISPLLLRVLQTANRICPASGSWSRGRAGPTDAVITL